MKTIFKGKNGPIWLSFMLVGSMIGAGFITGSEIWHFFARFNGGLVFGCSILFLLIYYLVYSELNKKFDSDYMELKTRQKWAREWVNYISELLIASAMISGLKNIISTLFNFENFIVFLCIVLVIFIILFFGFKLFSLYNYFLIGFIVFVVGVVLLNFNVKNGETALNIDVVNSVKSCVYAVLYVFMNISAIRPIIREFSPNFTKNKAKFPAVFFALLMLNLILIISIFLIKNTSYSRESMPLLSLFEEKGKILKIVFSVGVIFSMISTSVGCLFGVKSKIVHKTGDNLFSSVVCVLVSLILSNFSFNFFVSVVYPIIGFLNFLIFVFDILKK